MSWRASRARELLQTAAHNGGHSATARVELLRRAALLADSEGDLDTATRARHAIVDGHVWTNSEIDVIAAFAWLLHSASPVSYERLWMYKWVVAVLTEIVSIQPELIQQAIDDLERRYVLGGLSTAPAAQLRLEAAIAMRRREQLPELYAAWQRNESGAGSDCAACRRDKRVWYFAALGDDKRVVTESKPFVEGSLRCTEVPRGTFPIMLLPLLRTGRTAEADDVCRRGLELLGESERISSGMGTYLVYLALRGRIEDGCAVFATWLRKITLTRSDLSRFGFWRGAALLFHAAEVKRTGVVHLALPPTWPGYEPDALYAVGQLREWFDQQAGELARRFDRRHGNSAFQDELVQDRELLREFG
jgi:hypothetical protein